ncbi:DUF1738 domain-containing protein [Acidipila sp. EB88]|nr:DUF1738 domain-containing protein [Acidipila sp. EB88]
MKKPASKKTSAPKLNIYETVTARILASLRAGVVPWSKPWQGNSKGTAFPSNYRTLPRHQRASAVGLAVCLQLLADLQAGAGAWRHGAQRGERHTDRLLEEACEANAGRRTRASGLQQRRRERTRPLPVPHVHRVQRRAVRRTRPGRAPHRSPRDRPRRSVRKHRHRLGQPPNLASGQ